MKKDHTALKAVSLWQPWAQGMALDLKRNETRHWPTQYRGDIVICSAKRPLDAIGRDVCSQAGIDPAKLVFGCALCIVELYDVVNTELFHTGGLKCPFKESILGNYDCGRFAWLTRNLRVLTKPVPITGHQGLFNITGEDAARIRAAAVRGTTHTTAVSAANQ